MAVTRMAVIKDVRTAFAHGTFEIAGTLSKSMLAIGDKDTARTITNDNTIACKNARLNTAPQSGFVKNPATRDRGS